MILPLTLKVEVGGCSKLLPPIFDHAKSNKMVIFKLKRLVFELFNNLGVSLWASIMGCSDFFFLKNVLTPSQMTTFHG